MTALINDSEPAGGQPNYLISVALKRSYAMFNIADLNLCYLNALVDITQY